MTAETLRDNLQAVLPGTDILVRINGALYLVQSAEISAGGGDDDSVILNVERKEAGAQ